MSDFEERWPASKGGKTISELRQAIRLDRRLLENPKARIHGNVEPEASGFRDRIYEVGSRLSPTELPVLSPNLNFVAKSARRREVSC
jgi:hypothetical protein